MPDATKELGLWWGGQWVGTGGPGTHLLCGLRPPFCLPEVKPVNAAPLMAVVTGAEPGLVGGGGGHGLGSQGSVPSGAVGRGAGPCMPPAGRGHLQPSLARRDVVAGQTKGRSPGPPGRLTGPTPT